MSGIYRGVVIKEALNDISVLSHITVVAEYIMTGFFLVPEQPAKWTRLSYRVDAEDVEYAARAISKSLKPRAWYANLWREGDFMLIFPNKIFRAKTVDDPIWHEALAYSNKIGIPPVQIMDIDYILHVT